MLKKCVQCGAEIEGSHRKRFCPECLARRRREYQSEYRSANKKKKCEVQERPIKKFSRDPLDGKTHAQINAEARACGLGYGEYVSRVKMGLLTPLMLSSQDENGIWKRRVW